VKWKNIDVGASYYYITGTFVEWLPLLNNAIVRDMVCDEIGRALLECEGCVSAFVLMPDHVHLLVYLPDGGCLHRFNKLWRGRSAQRIVAHATEVNATKILDVMARHANGKSNYAVWKEQVRALAIYSEKKLYAMVNYIHFNPVRRGLVSLAEEWPFSSWRFYECGENVVLDVEPLIL
jgi:putative transposase